MEWILWFGGLILVAVIALSATGAFGSLDDEQDFIPNQADPTSDPTLRKIPLALFGYKREVVDSLLDELAAKRDTAAND
jgi:hypothetical protein